VVRFAAASVGAFAAVCRIVYPADASWYDKGWWCYADRGSNGTFSSPKYMA